MIDFRLALPAHTTVGRLIRLPLRLIPSDAEVPILTGPLRGCKWTARAGNHGCWLGTYELTTQRRIVTEIGTCDVAVDLGANHGFFTLLLSKHCRRVVAVEPFPPNIVLLQRHLSINHIENCSVVRAAVARESGNTSFSEGSNHATGRISPGGAITVNTVSLPDLMATFGPASFIKMDVEGAELEALIGGSDYLRQFRPKLLISTHSVQIRQQCLDLLGKLGFTLQVDDFDIFAS